MDKLTPNELAFIALANESNVVIQLKNKSWDLITR